MTGQVEDAVKAADIDTLRELSLQPGGFGNARAVAWPFLLGAHVNASAAPTSDEPHKDENQVKLDTDRAFVLYPDVREIEKDKLKARLNALITKVLRKRRKLFYVQGYHDVLSVLLLTLCPLEDCTASVNDLLFACSEKMSLYRLRDAMGPGLEPLLGLLRILRRLLRLADPGYARLIEKTTPLPYFALSNLLTLFSHDIPTLPLIQHIFDFLLCQEPIMVLYLAAALILKRKAEVEQRVEEEGDEGAMYVLLSGLPPLLDVDASSMSMGSTTNSTHTAENPVERSSDDGEKAPESSESSSPTDEPPPYSPASSDRPPPPPISLPSLLQDALTLHSLYPPSHSSLKVSLTLGSLSAHRAPWPPWENMSDDEAEASVLRPTEVNLSLDVDEEEEVDEFKGTAAERQKKREVEMRTLMAVVVLGAGVLIAIYSAEGGLGRVDWRGLARIVGGIARDAGERLARGG